MIVPYAGAAQPFRAVASLFPTRDAGACRKYVVSRRLNRWRVVRDASDAGLFPDLEAAVGFACGMARREAQEGVLGVVVVESAVGEMHCFTPPPAGVRQ